MNYTPQQEDIINYIKVNEGLVKVNAVAGAGKTTLLVGIAKEVDPKTGMYLAYNKSIATESKAKFPKSIDCRTTHSLAYGATVRPYKLFLGHFGYKEIKENISYPNKVLLLEYLKQFCLSEHTSFTEFAHKFGDISEFQIKIVNQYLERMATGEIQCTHDFYLKYYHMLLANGTITYKEPFDLIMLDESGDLNPVTLEIFKLLPAKRKVMVGDQHQNIYTFNHTINCFEEMKDEGAMFPMTQSFRVNENIATKIESFCKKCVDPTMEFKGIPITDDRIQTRAFIARTNGSLIGKMMELNDMNVPYTLSRPAKSIFRVPLLLCSLKPKGFVPDAEYNHLQDDVNEYYADMDLKEEYSLLGYIKNKHEEDVTLQSAANIIINYGATAVIDCFERAKRNEKVKANYMLCSAHSAKGLEFDEVTLAADMEKSIAESVGLVAETGIHPSKLTADARSELNLYYVACSRAKKVLNGANYLNRL